MRAEAFMIVQGGAVRVEPLRVSMIAGRLKSYALPVPLTPAFWRDKRGRSCRWAALRQLEHHDLADLREYQYHDDVRYIDWNVTARLQTPYVREYNEDRDVTAWFLLDLSPSVNFGSRTVKKATLATEFVTVLARLLTRHGNPVGALLYGDSVDTVIAARSGRRHVLHILHTMLSRPELTQSGATNLQDLLQNALRVMRRRSLVFVVSDFLSTPGWAEPLGQLARRHEIVAVRLFDPLELELPISKVTCIKYSVMLACPASFFTIPN